MGRRPTAQTGRTAHPPAEAWMSTPCMPDRPRHLAVAELAGPLAAEQSR